MELLLLYLYELGWWISSEKWKADTVGSQIDFNVSGMPYHSFIPVITLPTAARSKPGWMTGHTRHMMPTGKKPGAGTTLALSGKPVRR
jgi:hypothetical protein